MAERTRTCMRCGRSFTEVGPGRPSTACPDCRTHCAVLNCDRPHRTAGFCHPHYERWRKGEPLPTLIERRDGGERFCAVHGCSKRCNKSGPYCPMHYQRVRRDGGDPGPAERYAPPLWGQTIWDTPDNRRRVARLWKFGLTPEAFGALLASQGGRCAICGTDNPKRGNRVATWTVDHDHSCCPGKTSCGKCVRGLLCSPCNRGMGILGDDPVILEAAAAYLRRHAKARLKSV